MNAAQKRAAQLPLGPTLDDPRFTSTTHWGPTLDDDRFASPNYELPPLSLRMRDHVNGRLGHDLVNWVQNRLAIEGAEWRLKDNDPNAFQAIIVECGTHWGYPPKLVWCWFLCAWRYSGSELGTEYLPVIWELVRKSEWLPAVAVVSPSPEACRLLCAVAVALQDLNPYSQFFIPPKEAQQLLKHSGIDLGLREVNACIRALESAGLWDRLWGSPRAGYCWYVYRGPELAAA